MSDAEVLSAAAAVIRRRSRDPGRFAVRVLVKVLEAAAAELREADGHL
jgi:hypothetical protein